MSEVSGLGIKLRHAREVRNQAEAFSLPPSPKAMAGQGRLKEKQTTNSRWPKHLQSIFFNQ